MYKMRGNPSHAIIEDSTDECQKIKSMEFVSLDLHPLPKLVHPCKTAQRYSSLEISNTRAN